MEQYIVIAKQVPNAKNKYEDYRILKIDTQNPIAGQIPEGYEKKYGPASLDDCVRYVKEISENSPNWFGLTLAQYGLIFAVTLAFVGIILFGAYKLPAFESKDPGGNLIADDSARILITFLVAVGTIAIAFLSVLTAMVIREYKERFALAKEVLTILVGILGTIVGFYFGAAKSTLPPSNRNDNTNSVNGSNQGNTNTNTDTNTNTNTNVRTRILRLPSGKERLVVSQDFMHGFDLLIRTACSSGLFYLIYEFPFQ